MKTTLFLLFVSVLSFAQTSLIPMGSNWKYLSQGTAAPSNWNTSSYSDVSWPSGSAQLGFGDGDEVTVTPQVVSGNTVITTYFRKAISVASPTNCTISMVIDDGSIVYINGIEVNRYNLPTGTILYSTLTPTFTENSSVTFTVPASVFVSGTNIIAVEVHQNALNSSDLSFDFSMSTILSGCANHLVNYDYSFYVNVADPTLVNSINWGPDFSLPSRFINSWQYTFTFAPGSWDVPIKHGWSHTFSWFNVPDRTVVPVSKRDKMWGSPGCNVRGFWETYRTNNTYYNDMLDKYKHIFKTGDNLNWTPVYTGTLLTGYTCPPTPAVSTLTNNSGSFWVAAYDNAGTVVKNTDIHSMDFEVQYGIDRHYGAGGLDSWLQCLKSNSTTGSCASFVDGTVLDVSRHMPTPSYLSSLSFADFKKAYFRARIKDLNASLSAYKSIMASPGMYNNWGTDIEDVNVFNTFPSVTWSQLTTDPTKLSYVYRDTTNFNSYGNYYVNNLDIHTSINYFPWGRLGDYSVYSGQWLQNTLYTLELMKAWNPTKPCLNYVWMKNDGPVIYGNRIDSLVAEALPIFTMLSGADGNIMWDQETPGPSGVNNHIYDYYIKGMRRLSHFNSILTPTTVTYYKNLDPVQIRNLYNAQAPANYFTFGIARGIVKGDSILVAAMNPNAKIGQITKIPISFSNASYFFNDTVTVVGRKCFLGSAKMCSLGVTTIINSIFENSINALIYPNPSKNSISIKGLENSENIKSIVFRDILGREMFTTNQITDINVEFLNTGNYFVSIYNNDNVLLKTLRFIKD